MSTHKHAVGRRIHTQPGDLIQLVSYRLDHGEWLPTIRFGTYLGATDTHIRLVEDGHYVELDRDTWLEAIE